MIYIPFFRMLDQKDTKEALGNVTSAAGFLVKIVLRIGNCDVKYMEVPNVKKLIPFTPSHCSPAPLFVFAHDIIIRHRHLHEVSSTLPC